MTQELIDLINKEVIPVYTVRGKTREEKERMRKAYKNACAVKWRIINAGDNASEIDQALYDGYMRYAFPNI